MSDAVIQRSVRPASPERRLPGRGVPELVQTAVRVVLVLTLTVALVYNVYLFFRPPRPRGAVKEFYFATSLWVSDSFGIDLPGVGGAADSVISFETFLLRCVAILLPLVWLLGWVDVANGMRLLQWAQSYMRATDDRRAKNRRWAVGKATALAGLPDIASAMLLRNDGRAERDEERQPLLRRRPTNMTHADAEEDEEQLEELEEPLPARHRAKREYA